jgi:hypothetical protein
MPAFLSLLSFLTFSLSAAAFIHPGALHIAEEVVLPIDAVVASIHRLFGARLVG